MQAEAAAAAPVEGERKKRSFRKFAFRGVDLERLLELNLDSLLDLFHARARRKCAALACVCDGCLFFTLVSTPASAKTDLWAWCRLLRKNNRRKNVGLINRLRTAVCFTVQQLVHCGKCLVQSPETSRA